MKPNDGFDTTLGDRNTEAPSVPNVASDPSRESQVHPKVRLALNGLGRIGRLVLRHLQVHHPEIPIVAVNDVAEASIVAHLLKHDTVHGRAPFPVQVSQGHLHLGDRRIPVFQASHPADLPFGDLGATQVLECTGRFVTRSQAQAHLRGSVERVWVAAPMDDADRTVLRGINQDTLRPEDRILSAGSGTLACLAPMVSILDGAFGLHQALITVIHSYTSDQRILDLPHPDLRRARAAGLSMIPTPSRAPAALAHVLPHLKGRVDGIAVRVPTPDVSVLECTARLNRRVTPDDVHEAFSAAAAGPMAGLVAILDEALVSSDLVGRTESLLLDPFLTVPVGPDTIKLVAWYDNEVAYAARLVELALEAPR